MTATAAVLPAAVPRATSTPEPRDAASSPGKFDRQLDAARQKQASPADDGKKAPSGDQANKTADTPPAANAPAAVPAKTTAGTAVETTALAKDIDDDAPADGDTPAAALAGAMLALLGPATTTLRPPLAGLADAKVGLAGKAVAGDAGAAALLKLNTAATGTAANANITALPPGAGIMLAAGEARLAASEARLAAIDKPGDAAAQPAAALTSHGTGTQAAPAVHQLQIPTPAGSHGFAQELGQHVAWLGGQDVKQARIRLNPEDMGQLDIKISVNHGRVDVVFNAQHPGAVAAVQQSLPQLDQMLGQHGLSLGHTEVGQHDRGSHNGGERQTTEGAGIDDVGEIHGMTASPVSVGLLDAFA